MRDLNLRPLQLQYAVQSTELLRLDVNEMFEQKFKKIKVESNRKILQVYGSFWAGFK